MKTREQIESEIRGLHQLLTSTDYKALKHADGVLSDEDYEETRQLRIAYRNKINNLEIDLAKLASNE